MDFPPILYRLQDCEDSPNTPETIEALQRAVGVRFPEDYVEFLLQFNGGHFQPWVQFDLPMPLKFVRSSTLDSFMGHKDGKFDEFVNIVEEFHRFFPETFVPISYCATPHYIVVLKFTAADSEFDGVWLWDRSADPSWDEQILHPVADSFTEFLSMLYVYDEEKVRETLPLFQAVERGGLTAVERYLAEGGNPNSRNEKGQTLLTAAGIYRWPQIVRLLLEHSADPNARDSQGRTPLHHAARSVDSVKLLLAAGADVQARDNEGKSVLADECYWRANRILRAHGAED